ncbi:MAG: AsmA family protein [Alphaproteobacteria bacterium]|nr:AsmA family protein [Alphaproteobacteria bacterium]
MKTISVILSLIAIVVVMALVAPMFIDWNAYKSQIQEQIKSASGYDVTLNGDLGLGILPVPSFTAQDVKIQVPGTRGPFATVKRVHAALDVFALLSRQVSITAVLLDAPQLTLEATADGRNNWSLPAQNSAQQSAATQATTTSANTAGGGVSVDHISIRDGSVSYSSGKGQPFTIASLDAQAAMRSLEGPYELKGDARALGHDIDFDISSGARSPDVNALPIKAMLRNEKGVSFTYSGVVNTKGPLDFQGEIEGSVPDLKDMGVAGPYKAVNIRGLVQGTEKALSSKDLRVDLDGQGLSGTLDIVYNPLAVKAVINTPQNFILGAMRAQIQGTTQQDAIDFSVHAAPIDFIALMKAANPEADAAMIPAEFKQGTLDVSLKGTAAKADLSAGLSAAGGTVTIRAPVETPLAGFKLGVLNVGASHKNLLHVLEIFAPGAPRYTNWAQPFDVRADIAVADKTYSFKNIKGTMAGSSLSGNLNINSSAKIPALNGALKFGNLTMVTEAGRKAQAGNAAQSLGDAASKAPAAKSPWSAAAIDSRWMNAVDVDLNISADKLTYDQWELLQPSLRFAAGGGKMQIENLKAGVFGGSLALDATASGMKDGQGISLDSKTSITNVQLEPMMRALVGTPLVRGRGAVNLQADLKGAGLSQKDLIGNLNGQGTLTGQKLVLEGFDLERFGRALSEETKPGDTLLGLWKGTIKGGSTAFDTLDGAYGIQNGVVALNKLDLTGPTAIVKTKGDINLPAWTIRTAHTISLPRRPDVPEFTVHLAGPLDNPGQTFAQGAIEDYLKRKLERKLQKVIQDKLGDKLNIPGLLGGGQQQNPPTNDNSGDNGTNPEDAVKDLLKGILN